MKDFDFIYKVIVIGDSNVGKTALTLKYTEDKFNANYKSTIGIDFRSKTVEFEDRVFKIQIWDTAGQEKYRAITKAYYRGANGIILVFDVTCRKSFENVVMWLRSIEGDACTVLVGNKCDIVEREVTTAEAQALAGRYDIEYFETSALSGVGIQRVFESLIYKIYHENSDVPAPTVLQQHKCCFT